MKAKVLFLLLSFFIIFNASAEEKLNYVDQYNLLTIGTGSITGLYYPIGGAICRLVNKNIKEFAIRCGVKYSSGSKENLRAVTDKEIDFAIMQSDVFYNAYYGLNNNNMTANKSLRSVLSLYPESLTVVVKANSGIDRFDSIKGKRIVIEDDSSGSKGIIEKLFAYLGYQSADFSSLQEMDISIHPKALCSDAIDVMIFNAGHPNGVIREVSSACDVKILPVEGKVINDFLKTYVYYDINVIKGGTYAGNPNDINTFGTKAILVTTDRVNTDTVYKVAKSILDTFRNFRALHPVLYNLEIQDMFSGLVKETIHDGVIKYVKDSNLFGNKFLQ